MIDFRKATPTDKEQLLGREFRDIHVVGAEFTPAASRVEVILDGHPVTLIGEPRAALATYLGGNAATPETQP